MKLRLIKMSYYKVKNKFMTAEKKIEKTVKNIRLYELKQIFFRYRYIFLSVLLVAAIVASAIQIYLKPTIFSAQIKINYLGSISNEIIVKSRNVIRDPNTLSAVANRVGEGVSVASLQKDILVTKLPEEKKVIVKAFGISEEQAEKIVHEVVDEYRNIMEAELTKKSFPIKLVYEDAFNVTSSFDKIINIVVALVGSFFTIFLVVLVFDRYKKR